MHAQDFSTNSVKVGAGLGFLSGNQTDGGGFVYSIGYQKDVWNSRMRINPNFSIGHYSSKFIMDARDQYFNSINLQTNVFFDLLKVNKYAFIIACGVLANNSRGLKGSNVEPEVYNNKAPRSEYVSNIHLGGYLGAGYRINPSNKRTAINILPFNVHFGTNDFMEFTMKIEMDFYF